MRPGSAPGDGVVAGQALDAARTAGLWRHGWRLRGPSAGQWVAAGHRGVAKVPDSATPGVSYCRMSLTDYRAYTMFESTGDSRMAQASVQSVPLARRDAGPGGPVADEPALVWQWPLRMANPVRRLPWGSKTALARLQGRPAAASPEAELCMGALGSAGSMLLTHG